MGPSLKDVMAPILEKCNMNYEKAKLECKKKVVATYKQYKGMPDTSKADAAKQKSKEAEAKQKEAKAMKLEAEKKKKDAEKEKQKAELEKEKAKEAKEKAKSAGSGAGSGASSQVGAKKAAASATKAAAPAKPVVKKPAEELADSIYNQPFEVEENTSLEKLVQSLELSACVSVLLFTHGAHACVE